MRCARALLPLTADDDRHMCMSFIAFRTTEAKKKWTTNCRTRPRRISKARRRSEKTGRACLPAAFWAPRPTPMAPCTHARARARTHTHAHAYTRTLPCASLQAMRPSQSTERETESPHRISTPAAPFSNRGHNVEITWARHAFTSARHLCLPPGPRDGGGRAWAPNCGARESLARPPSSPKARTKAGFCTHDAAAVAVGSWRAWSGATRARCPAAAPAGACAKRPTR